MASAATVKIATIPPEAAGWPENLNADFGILIAEFQNLDLKKVQKTQGGRMVEGRIGHEIFQGKLSPSEHFRRIMCNLTYIEQRLHRPRISAANRQRLESELVRQAEAANRVLPFRD